MPLHTKDVFDRAKDGEFVVGWTLDPDQRMELLLQFPPRYGQTVADHVTLLSEVAVGTEPPSEITGEIVGRADDGVEVEALVVRIGDTTDRPGGGTYHITWSLEPDRSAKDSNDVIARSGWTPLELAMPVLLVPACWPRTAR